MDAFENRDFVDNSNDDIFTQNFKDDAGDLFSTTINKARDLKDMVVKETKTLAPTIKLPLTSSATRLDGEKRVFLIIPNSVLYYTLVGLGIYFVAKQLK